jgi:hypothetical protein
MSRKHLPAAVLVSISCSVAFKVAPLAFTARTMSYRASRSIRATISTSPLAGSRAPCGAPRGRRYGCRCASPSGATRNIFCGRIFIYAPEIVPLHRRSRGICVAMERELEAALGL